MWKAGILLTAILICATVLTACGDSAEPPPRSAAVKGAPPIAPSPPDGGILQDQAHYQPATFTPPPSKPKESPAAEGGAAQDTSEAAAVREFILEVMRDLEAGRIERALSKIEPAPGEAARAHIQGTLELITALTQTVTEKLGPGSQEELSEVQQKALADSIQVELTGPDSATVTPNLLILFLGPELATDTAKLVKMGGEWRFLLETPLTGADLDKLAVYHQTTQEQLKQFSEVIQQAGPAELQALRETFMALAGIAGPAPNQAAPASAPSEEPNEGGRPAP
ncbi:MAG: hypothetical protein GX547_08500 [Phycisphaerae bacterium]|nr:hypothetical protein [Phycisphaerae bacterium]